MDAESNSLVDGFLSLEIGEVERIVRQRYAAWRGLLLDVNRLSVSTQHRLVIHYEEDAERYAAVLFARIISTVQGAILLLERGLIPQARTVLRSALEGLFQLGAIASDASIAQKLIDAHAAEQKRAARNMMQWKDSELRKLADKQAADGGLQPFLESKASSLSVADLAEMAGMGDWYRSLYMTLSWSTHVSPIDLNRHVVVSPDGASVEFRNEPEIEGQESSWACAMELLLKAMTALGRIFPGIDQSSIDGYYVRARELVALLEADG